MGAVSNVLDFKDRVQPATLVLVDLHREPRPLERLNEEDFSRALDKCRAALAFARQAGLPVAFVRQTAPPPSLLSAQSYPSWLRGFLPQRCDMIFERAMPSCYASADFSDMAQRHGELVLAGVFGETSCLATLVEAYSRGHVFTYLSDASVSRGRNSLSAVQMHQSVTEIASFYGEVSSTDAWIERMSRRAGVAG